MYLRTTKCRPTGTMVTVGHSTDLRLPKVEGLPWYAICEDHGESTTAKNRDAARALAADTSTWCPICKGGPTGPETARTRTGIRKALEAGAEYTSTRPVGHHCYGDDCEDHPELVRDGHALLACPSCGRRYTDKMAADATRKPERQYR